MTQPIPKPTPRVKEPRPLRSRPKGVPSALRDRVFTRDNYTCAWCGEAGGGLDPHHRRPRGRGGVDSYDNLVAVHRKCHRQIHEAPAEAIRRGFTIEGAA